MKRLLVAGFAVVMMFGASIACAQETKKLPVGVTYSGEETSKTGQAFAQGIADRFAATGAFQTVTDGTGLVDVDVKALDIKGTPITVVSYQVSVFVPTTDANRFRMIAVAHTVSYFTATTVTAATDHDFMEILAYVRHVVQQRAQLGKAGN